jgi:hypothetical protein
MANKKSTTKAKGKEAVAGKAVGKVDAKAKLAALIEAGVALNERKKQDEKRLKAIKEELKKLAKKNKWKEKELDGFLVAIVATSKTAVDPVAFVRKLKAEKKLDLIHSVITVRVQDAKKYLGTEFLDGISEDTWDDFGRVDLKSKSDAQLENAQLDLEKTLEFLQEAGVFE